MSTLDQSVIDTRLRAIEASYQRQLSLAGKPGYDPKLTIQLKEDFEWLLTQRQSFESVDSDQHP